ncbi:MAG: hypothetical protein Q8904_14680 [Bacteroidota bacterium]|nr:hypothetical protein [Bacteroidota bacterium]
MRKIIFTIGFWWLVCIIIAAQPAAFIDVTGKWQVVGGEIQLPTVPADGTTATKKQIAGLKEQFLHSVFVFRADHNFDYNIAIDELKIQKAHWRFNASNNRYEIQEWADKDKNNSFLMEIEVKREGDKTFFVLPLDDDLPKEFSVKLEVVKIIELSVTNPTAKETL